MTGILMLESLTRGNTLKQGDKTPLTYRLLDADGDNLNVAGKQATVRLVHPNYLTIGYEKSGLVVSQDDTVTFTIDNVIPSRKYNVEIIVDNKYVFPSRSAESKFTIDRSTLGTEANIIEIVGVDAVVNKVLDQVNTGVSEAVTDINATHDAIQQAEQERVQAYQEIKQIIADGSISAVPLDGSLTTPKYADESITPRKTSFLSGGRNLFKKSERLINKYWQNISGTMTLSYIKTLSTFEPIPVKEGETYYKNRGGHISFSRDDYTVVSNLGYQTPAGAYTTPPGATLMFFSVYNEDVDEYQIERGSHGTDYDDGSTELNPDVKIHIENSSITPEKTTFLTEHVDGTTELDPDVKIHIENSSITPEKTTFLTEYDDGRTELSPNVKVHIENRSITPEKTTFLSGGRNLFDKNAAVSRHYWTREDGVLVLKEVTSLSTHAAPFPVKEGETYYKNRPGHLYFTDENNNVLFATRSDEPAGAFTAPSGSKYLYVNILIEDVEEYQVERGNKESPYDDGTTALNPDVKVSIEDSSITPEKTTFVLGKRNLFKKHERLISQYWTNVSGILTLSDVGSLDTFEPIPVKAGETYYKNRSGHITFANDEYTIISNNGYSTPAGAYTVPEGATLMTFSVLKEDVDDYQIEKGDHETEYDDGNLSLSSTIKIKPASLPAIMSASGGTPKYYTVNAAGNFTVYLPITKDEYVTYSFVRDSLENYMKMRGSGIFTKTSNGFTHKFDLTEPASNKEFAINVSPEDGSTGAWFPQHNNIGTAFITEDGLQEFMADGELVDLETPTTDYTPFDTASFSQVVHAKLPDDVGNRARIVISYDFDRIIKQYFEIEFLMNTRINKFYSFMMPLQQNYVEKVKTNRREIVYAQETTETVETQFTDSTATEFIATSKEADKQHYYVRYKMTNKSHELEKLFLEHRGGRMQKLYPMIAEKRSVLMGEKYYYDGEYEIGKLLNANEVYG